MKKSAALIAVTLLASVAAHAQVTVDKPWVRTTVAQQTTTGAFMTITSVHGGKLVFPDIPRF